MAGSPQFKVYRAGEYVAACKYPEDAAAIAGMGGEKVQVRYGHSAKAVLYDHTADNEMAGDSWDGTAMLMLDRLSKLNTRG